MFIASLAHLVILCFLLMTVFVIIRMRDLLATTMLMGIYGLLSASFFVLMDAVDVALTEAAVGIGISTILLLTTISLTNRYEKKRHNNHWLALLVILCTGSLLIYGTFDMPPFGSAQTPAQTHVASHYISESFRETGVFNLVSSVLASYRGYDTMGELIVIFTAGIGVVSILSAGHSGVKQPHKKRRVILPMTRHHILRIVAKMLIPFVMIFALYIQFHGDFGPGGGFQAGAIFATALILYTMIFGLENALAVFSKKWLAGFAALGVLIYAGSGVISLFSALNFLDYHALSSDPITGQHIGIMAVELGVGITVASVIFLIFLSFTEQLNDQRDNS